MASHLQFFKIHHVYERIKKSLRFKYVVVQLCGLKFIT